MMLMLVYADINATIFENNVIFFSAVSMHTPIHMKTLILMAKLMIILSTEPVLRDHLLG